MQEIVIKIKDDDYVYFQSTKVMVETSSSVSRTSSSNGNPDNKIIDTQDICKIHATIKTIRTKNSDR